MPTSFPLPSRPQMRLLGPVTLMLAAIALIAPIRTSTSSALQAQAPTPPADSSANSLPLVFLDCRAEGCDGDFLRTELTWMNFVRDRNQALVHIIATTRRTASGGAELSVTFDRGNGAGAVKDSVLAIIPQGSTEDQARRVVARVIGQGMLHVVRNTALGNQLSISYRPTSTKASDTRGAKDKWHLWVFRISGSGFGSGDANYKSFSANSSVSASRTTEQWKSNFSLNGNYRENSYALSETEKLRTYQHSWGGFASVVKSLTPRWSLGGTANASSSVQSNQDFFLRAGPALEFDLFPYAQSTRRQVIFRYTPGVRIANYTEYTIYDKLEETHLDHQMLIGAELTQKWGSISASTSFNQLLDDPSKNNLNLNGGLSWRVTTGLNLNVGGGYSRIRNQLNLKRGKQQQQEVLLQLRQLRTGYSYYGNVGLSFTFGSIFQNVVNPRLSFNNFF